MPIQRWSEQIWVAQLANEPALSEDLLLLKEEAQRIKTPPNIVLDLSGITHLNSTNLSQMLRIRKLAIERGLKLVLAGPRDSIWAVFLTTGLDKVFDFSPDVSTALAGLQISG